MGGKEIVAEKDILMADVAIRIVGMIDQIEVSQDAEEIEMLIDSIDFLDNKIRAIFGYSPGSVRPAIKEGRGDLKRIQQKCIQMNVV